MTHYTNGAILAHPGDRGMKCIADALFEAMQVRGGLKLGPGNGDKGLTAGTDKTLVSWVALANTTQQGGSALTIQSGKAFDGIVFGEAAPGKWMAGSDYLARTQRDQQANALEKADDKIVRPDGDCLQGQPGLHLPRRRALRIVRGGQHRFAQRCGQDGRFRTAASLGQLPARPFKARLRMPESMTRR